MTPNELVEWLNEYLSAMTDYPVRHQGTLTSTSATHTWPLGYALSAGRSRRSRLPLRPQMNRAWTAEIKWRAEGKKEAAWESASILSGERGNMGSAKRIS